MDVKDYRIPFIELSPLTSKIASGELAVYPKLYGCLGAVKIIMQTSNALSIRNVGPIK